MEFRIISSRVKVTPSDQGGAKVVFFEDDGRARATIFLKYDDTARDLINQLRLSLPTETK